MNELAALDVVSRVTTWLAYAVFFGSLLSNLLAIFEAWAEKWWPGSRFGFVLAVTNDLISRFLALNWRDRIAQQPGDRRQTSILPNLNGK